MQIFNDKKQRVGILKGFKDRKIVKTLNSGDRELSFKYPSDGEKVDQLKEEYYIRTKDDEYVIRKKKTGVQFNEYTAQLNVEELEGAVFPYGFESKEQTIRACLEFAFEGTGWKVGVCQITKKRTINKDEETNAWDVLQDCLSTYRVECKIRSLEKTIDIYEQIGADRGRYFIEGLNLKKLTVTSDTYDFYTRLIPLGKDGIGIEWLGKPYLENYQYSSKVKTYVWSDERYTNTTSLIEDGIAKLEEMSKPYVAYKADVIDLARQSKKYSSVFDFDIGDTVWMISKSTKTKEKQRIVKLTEYPESPQSNTVELSNASRRKKRRKKSLTSWIMEFSKKVVVVCVLLYIIIELFSVIAIWHFADTSVLTTLISETSEVLRMGVFGYMIKAGIENWQKIKKGKQESENEEGGANG